MRILQQERGYFRGTHKGCEIEIERDRESGRTSDRHFYITVRTDKGGGGYLYDGWSPVGITTMREAKREALYGACLEPRPDSSRGERG